MRQPKEQVYSMRSISDTQLQKNLQIAAERRQKQIDLVVGFLKNPDDPENLRRIKGIRAAFDSIAPSERNQIVTLTEITASTIDAMIDHRQKHPGITLK